MPDSSGILDRMSNRPGIGEFKMATAIDDRRDLSESEIEEREGFFEFIDGRYVEKPSPGASASELTLLLMFRLMGHVLANRLGHCYGAKTVYQIFPDDPKRSRIPDGSFIRAGRLPKEKSPRGELSIAPDLAIEVVSPNDFVENLHERINDLLGAGVRLLWVVVPGTREIYVHRGDRTVTRLSTDDELTGEDVVPGFSCRIGELFDAV